MFKNLKFFWVLDKHTTEHHLPDLITRASQQFKEPINLAIITVATTCSELHNLNKLNQLPSSILSSVNRLSLIVADNDSDFTERDALEILEFLQTVFNKANMLIVTCQLGKSRSPAIAMAIDELILKNKPSKFLKDFANTYNRHIYKVLTNIWSTKLNT